MNRKDLELETTWLELRERFVNAKKHMRDNPDEYRDAKAAVTKFRMKWKPIRDYLTAVAQDSDSGQDAAATPDSIAVTGVTQEG